MTFRRPTPETDAFLKKYTWLAEEGPVAEELRRLEIERDDALIEGGAKQIAIQKMVHQHNEAIDVLQANYDSAIHELSELHIELENMREEMECLADRLERVEAERDYLLFEIAKS